MTQASQPDSARDLSLYRPCVGVALINREGLIFAGRRLDTPDAWQMPQGGLDKGETPLEGGLRELREETGLLPEHVRMPPRMPSKAPRTPRRPPTAFCGR